MNKKNISVKGRLLKAAVAFMACMAVGTGMAVAETDRNPMATAEINVPYAAAAGIAYGHDESIVNENPEIRVFIDCEEQKYESVPIYTERRVPLLPLRELLSDLGVQNDSEHIVWDTMNKCVTVKKDNKVMVLTLGSKSVLIDGQKVSMDEAPFIYKEKIYIPISFAEKCMDRIVVWDYATDTVFMRNQKDFDEIKGMVEKALETTYSTSVIKVISMESNDSQYGDLKKHSQTDMEIINDDKTKRTQVSLNYNESANTIKIAAYLKDGWVYLMSTSQDKAKTIMIQKDDGKSALTSVYSIRMYEGMAGNVFTDSTYCKLKAQKLGNGGMVLKWADHNVNKDEEYTEAIEINIDEAGKIIKASMLAQTKRTSSEGTYNSKKDVEFSTVSGPVDIKVPDYLIELRDMN